MISDSVKIAKIKARADKDVAMMNMIRAIAGNPAIELLGSALVLIEMRKHKLFDGVSGSIEEAALMAMIAGAVGLQQVAPLAPSMAQGAEGIGKALPGILALTAGA